MDAKKIQILCWHSRKFDSMDSSIGHQWHEFLLLKHHHRHHLGHDYDQCCNVKLKLMILQFNISLQQNRINASASAHGILAFLFPILLAFLQLKISVEVASPSSDLFQTRPIISMLSVSSLLAYCLALGASLGFPCYARSFRIAAVFLGSLSVASLASLLLPHNLFPLPYIIYVLVILVPAVLLRRFIPLGHHNFSSQSSCSWHNKTTLFTNIFDHEVMHALLPVTAMDSQQEQ